VTDALRWLSGREPPPSAILRERIEEAVRLALATAAADTPLPKLLATAGLERLRLSLSHAEERDAAFDLLAADALLTYACEAAAELGDDALARLQEDLSPDRFAALLEPPVA
jgi:hypothetical protein